MRRVPRVQSLQFAPSTNRTAAAQHLVRSLRDALFGISDVADASGTVTLDSPEWFSGWHAPLLKLAKASNLKHITTPVICLLYTSPSPRDA